MPTATIPALDQSHIGQWQEQDVNLYNSLPYYFAKMQVMTRDFYPSWAKLLGSIPWRPNQGKQMKAVRKVASPHIRQFAHPNKIFDQIPLKDIMDVREVEVLVDIYRHRFESPVFNFQPSFKDFMKDHIAAHTKDISEKQIRYQDIFCRGRIFHEASHVIFPDASGTDAFCVSAPWGPGDNAGSDTTAFTYQGSNTAKSTAWIQANLNKIGNPGNLTFRTLNLALSVLENDHRIPCYSGSDLPKDDQGLSGKFCLICSGEAWNQFMFDPWILANKPLDMDVVHNGWKGNFFGRITTKIEDLPLRISADGTFPAPQVRELNAAAYNYEEPVNRVEYNAAPYEVAFLAGANGYETIDVGPPPAPFSGGNVPEGFGKMQWNGEIILSKNLLIAGTDAATGSTILETNEYGDFLHLISQAAYGIIPKQRRSIIPIIFKRLRGVVP